MLQIFQTSRHYFILIILVILIVIAFRKKSKYSILIVSSIFVVGLIYFLLDPLFNKFREGNGAFVGSLIEIIATLFGVYVALFATNKQTDKDNRELIIKLIGGVQSELKVHSMNFKAGEIYILDKYKKDKDFIKIQDSMKEKNYQLVPEFRSCDLLFNNDLFLKYVNSVILINILSIDKMVKNDFYYMNFKTFNSVQDYIKFEQNTVAIMSVIGKVLDVQIKEIRNEIKSKDAASETKLIIDTYLNQKKTENIGGLYFFKK